MGRYAIIENSKVVNIVISGSKLEHNWVANPPNNVQIGWQYDGEGFTSPLIYKISNHVITVDGVVVEPFAGNYYCDTGSMIQLVGDITDQTGNILTNITIPVTLKMPLVRHANGVPTTDEMYMNVTLINGVITATGKVDRSGDWKILIERNNEALSRIGVDWKLRSTDITFLV